MTNGTKTRAPKNTSKLSPGLAADLLVTVIQARDVEPQRAADKAYAAERKKWDERYDAIVARVPEDQRERTARLVTALLGDIPDASTETPAGSKLSPSLLTEPEPVPYTEIDRATGTTKAVDP